MLIHVINRETGFLTAYTPTQLAKMARAFVKPTGRKYDQHWLEFDERGKARIVVQSTDNGGWSRSDGIVI
jgi:hypothetical protein